MLECLGALKLFCLRFAHGFGVDSLIVKLFVCVCDTLGSFLVAKVSRNAVMSSGSHHLFSMLLSIAVFVRL